MPESEISVLALSGDLTAMCIAVQWRALPKPLPAALRIDLTQVQALDSAGVAFVSVLRGRLAAISGKIPALSGMPPRFRQLCLAHRVVLAGD